jgi:hypothetical protein
MANTLLFSKTEYKLIVKSKLKIEYVKKINKENKM